MDGKYTYSEIRQLFFGNSSIVCIHPNPAKDKLVLCTT